MSFKILGLSSTESIRDIDKPPVLKKTSSVPPFKKVECGDLLDVPKDIPQKDFVQHICSHECMKMFDKLPPHVEQNIRVISLLSLPFYYGFRRFYIMFTNTQSIVYTTPCGKVLYTPSHISEYLSIVLDDDFPLDVNYFTFSYYFSLKRTSYMAFDYLPDYTQGIEDRPISMINTMYNLKAGLRFDYNYIKDRILSEHLDIDVEEIRKNPIVKCDNDHQCTDWKSCSCELKTFVSNFNNLNGYVHKRLFHQHVGGIYECHDGCTCKKRCPNRLVQNGVTCNLQLFVTYNKGLGVRTLSFIPQGTFVACYNTLVTTQEHVSTVNTYHADMDFQSIYYKERMQFYSVNSINRLTGKTLDKSLFEKDFDENKVYVQDGTRHSNIARFFNHSCEPNLFCQSVFVDIQDSRVPLTALFAFRDILAFEELCWDYNNVHFISSRNACECGSLSCSSFKQSSDDEDDEEDDDDGDQT